MTSAHLDHPTAAPRNWWSEGWRLYARSVRQFFSLRRILTLLFIVVASAVVGGLVGAGMIALAANPRLSAGTFILMLAAAAGGASIVIALGVWYLRDLRADALSWTPLPPVIAALEKAPIPDGYHVDADTKALVISIVRRRRRSLTFAVTALMSVFLVGLTSGITILSLGEAMTPRQILIFLQCFLFLFLALSALRSLGQTTTLLAHTFSGTLPDVSISTPPTKAVG